MIKVYCDKCMEDVDPGGEYYCQGCIARLEKEVEQLGEEVIRLEKKYKEGLAEIERKVFRPTPQEE